MAMGQALGAPAGGDRYLFPLKRGDTQSCGVGLVRGGGMEGWDGMDDRRGDEVCLSDLI